MDGDPQEVERRPASGEELVHPFRPKHCAAVRGGQAATEHNAKAPPASLKLTGLSVVEEP